MSKLLSSLGELIASRIRFIPNGTISSVTVQDAIVEIDSEKIAIPASSAQGDILIRGASSWTRLAAGTSGQYLKTQGASANPVWDTLSDSGVQTFTSSGTFTVPTGVTTVYVTMCGGGGGGAGQGGSTGMYGTGGKVGTYIMRKLVSGLTPGSSITVTVGAFGAGTTNGTGGTGGTSSFGAYCSAVGGVGGIKKSQIDPIITTGESLVPYGYAGANSGSASGYGSGGGGAPGTHSTLGGNGSPGFVTVEW